MINKKNHTIELVHIDGLSDEQIELIKKLNTTTNYDAEDPKDSIMHYGQLCYHDSGYLCECRLQYIIDQLRKQK